MHVDLQGVEVTTVATATTISTISNCLIEKGRYANYNCANHGPFILVSVSRDDHGHWGKEQLVIRAMLKTHDEAIALKIVLIRDSVRK